VAIAVVTLGLLLTTAIDYAVDDLGSGRGFAGSVVTGRADERDLAPMPMFGDGRSCEAPAGAVSRVSSAHPIPNPVTVVSRFEGMDGWIEAVLHSAFLEEGNELAARRTP
jgi:hypothetical protein